MLTAAIFFLLTGLLFILLSLPLIRGKVKPNAWYGFRIPETTNNPNVWYPANAYAGKGLRVSGFVTIAAALISLLIPGLTLNGYSIFVSLIMLTCLLVTLILSMRYAKGLIEEMGGQ